MKVDKKALPPPPPPIEYIIQMTEDEAIALLHVLDAVGVPTGSEQGSIYILCNQLHRALGSNMDYRTPFEHVRLERKAGR